MVPASSSVGTIFSRLAMTMWTLASDWVRSPFPSLVTITDWPVSAISMLAPVMPTSAAKYFSRSTARASASMVSSPMRRAGSMWVCSRRKRSATSSSVTWTAGAMMWLGVSWRIWTMYSPRSVSTAAMPCSSRCSLIPHSSEIRVLPLATVFAPASRQISSTIRRASSAVSAQWTWPPSAITCASYCSR